MSESLSVDEDDGSSSDNDVSYKDKDNDEDIMNKCREQLRSLKSGVISTNNDRSISIDIDALSDNASPYQKEGSAKAATSNDSSVGRLKDYGTNIDTIANDNTPSQDATDEEEPTTNIEPSVNKLLSNITVGTKVEIYWKQDDTYYSGVISKHLPLDDNIQPHRYEIRYDDGEVHEEDLFITPFRLPIGTRIKVYWKQNNEYSFGIISEHTSNEEKRDLYTIIYDNNDGTETIDLSIEQFHIVSTPASDDSMNRSSSSSMRRSSSSKRRAVGDRKPITPPEAFQGLTDEEYDLLWPGESNWTPYLPNQEKIQFYSCSFVKKTCEVEWYKEGFIETVQFKVAEQKRRRKQSTRYIAQPKEPRIKNKKKLEKSSVNSDSVIRKKRSLMDRKPPLSKRAATSTTSRATEQISTGHKAAAPTSHYITSTLNATREDILASLPQGMVDRFNDCCFALYGGGGIHRPVLILSPFDVTGDGEIVKQWVNRYQQYQKTGQMPYLVYW